jgi:hypothetical protein
VYFDVLRPSERAAPAGKAASVTRLCPHAAAPRKRLKAWENRCLLLPSLCSPGTGTGFLIVYEFFDSIERLLCES